jgi:hypothetical protein
MPAVQAIDPLKWRGFECAVDRHPQRYVYRDTTASTENGLGNDDGVPLPACPLGQCHLGSCLV